MQPCTRMEVHLFFKLSRSHSHRWMGRRVFLIPSLCSVTGDNNLLIGWELINMLMSFFIYYFYKETDLPPSAWNQSPSLRTSCGPGWAELRSPHTASPGTIKRNKNNTQVLVEKKKKKDNYCSKADDYSNNWITEKQIKVFIFHQSEKRKPFLATVVHLWRSDSNKL